MLFLLGLRHWYVPHTERSMMTLLFRLHMTLFEIERRILVRVRWSRSYVDARVAFDQFNDDAFHRREARVGDQVLQDRTRAEDCFDACGINGLGFPFEFLFEKLVPRHGL